MPHDERETVATLQLSQFNLIATTLDAPLSVSSYSFRLSWDRGERRGGKKGISRKVVCISTLY